MTHSARSSCPSTKLRTGFDFGQKTAYAQHEQLLFSFDPGLVEGEDAHF